VKVHGKSVVVTGAGRGIGAAMALRFAREGARAIVVSDVDGEAARQVAASITELGVTASSWTADVGDKEQVHTLIAHAERICGQLDLVCSNGGIATALGLHG